MGIYEHPGKFQFQLFAQPPASLSRPKLAAVSVTFVKFKMRCFEKNDGRRRPEVLLLLSSRKSPLLYKLSKKGKEKRKG